MTFCSPVILTISTHPTQSNSHPSYFPGHITRARGCKVLASTSSANGPFLDRTALDRWTVRRVEDGGGSSRLEIGCFFFAPNLPPRPSYIHQVGP